MWNGRARVCVCEPVCACAAGAKIKTHAHAARRARWPNRAPLYKPLRNATVLTVTMVICSSLSAARVPRKNFISREWFVWGVPFVHRTIAIYMYLLLDEDDDCWVWYGCSRFLVANARVNWLTWCITFGFEYNMFFAFGCFFNFCRIATRMIILGWWVLVTLFLDAEPLV